MSSPPKVAIVTGAGTGIGKPVALTFLQEGYRVALAGRRKEPLAQMASLPLDAYVLFITIMATKMPFVGRG
jgi:NADP-dependent 3-hydroxy acid dehydrogenase YdfG